jgi:butyrate kinase
MQYKLLIINPGSTSTKLSVFKEKEEIWSSIINHSSEDISRFNKIIEQLDWRQNLVISELIKVGFDVGGFDVIVARGGAGLDPISGGTYIIDDNMIKDLYEGKNAEHASNLGGIIAKNLAEEYNIPAYTVDPISVDEFEPLARISGLPELSRLCQSHALNLKAVARKMAAELGKNIENVNLIGVHLGGGISIAAMKKGRIIDVNNANQGGPYSPERVGSLPGIDLVNYIFEEKPGWNDFKKRLIGKGGLTAYLGTNDGREIEKRIKNGDKEAELIYQGMIYQIAKEIGSMSAVLNGDVNAIFITGGLAHSEYVVKGIEERIKFIADVKRYPGDEEMKNLAEGALRVLRGKEVAKEYLKERIKL